MRLLVLAFLLLAAPAIAWPSAPPSDRVLDEAGARAYLADREGLAGLDLVFEGAIDGAALRHFRFHQTVAGLPVEGTRAQVSADEAGRVVWTIADVERDLEAAPCPAMREASLAKARAMFPGELWTPPRAEHLVTHLGDTVWRVTVIPHEPVGAWRVEVRCDGAVTRVWDGARYFEAKAMLFPVNPIVASGNPDLRDNPAGLGLGMEDFRIEVPLRDIEGGAGSFLRGKYAWIATPLATASEGEMLDFDRGDPRFEDVNTYFWIDAAQRHIQSLGFDSAHNSTTTIVPRLPVAYTAFYTGDPAAEIFFGYHSPPVIVTYGIEHLTVGSKSGVADAAEDAFVILHEYGHAVLDRQAGICCTEEAGAMHEAFGDWQAASILTRWSNGTAEGCMGPWFGSYLKDPDGTWPCYRDLNNNATMDDWIPGDDPHFNQLIWSGALWATEKKFMERDGREKGAAAFERIMYESNYLLPVEATLASAVKAMIVADGALNGAANHDFLAEEFIARKIVTLADLPSVADVLVPTEAREVPPPPLFAPAPFALLAAGALAMAAMRRR